jgi:hypothetical protein
MSQTAKVTSIAQLQEYAKGQIVDLPPFAEGMPFTARMRRPSMLGMMKSGKIPNTLLASANALFEGTTSQLSKSDDELYRDVFEITEILAETALLEPTLAEITEAGVELTDDQYMFIFNYTQRGVKALESFRPVKATSESSKPEQPVQS